MIFNKEASTLIQFLDNIKLLSFWWLKTKFENIVFGYLNWCFNPL